LFSPISPTRALSHIATSLLSLVQTISFLPRASKGSFALLIFSICAILPLYHSNIAIHNGVGFFNVIGFHSEARHPVQILFQNAQGHASNLLARQATTMESAISEYQRRYRRDPPPGYEKWYEFAKSHHSLIIDDFDSIERSLAPFRKMTPGQLVRAMDEANDRMDPHIRRCSFKNGSYTGDCDYMGRNIDELLEPVRDGIPDVELLINLLDEPRLLLPSREPDEAQLTGEKQVSFFSKSFSPSWDTITAPCKEWGSHTIPPPKRSALDTYGLPFVQDVDSEKDICLHNDYEHLHGFLIAPASLRPTTEHVPLLSNAAPYPFSDILMPASFYTSDNEQYNETLDHTWDEKENKLYWYGSTTGSHQSDPNWKTHHRQRFAILGMHKDPSRNFSYLERNARGHWTPVISNSFNESLYNVSIGTVIQCDLTQCQNEKDFFNPPDPRPGPTEIYNARYVFDIDGNSYSGRYYRMLHSHSVPLKTTIFREWHDERLVPWLHYIPVSLSFEELPELMRFLATTEEGQRISFEIAQSGREWAEKVLRKVDTTIYLYRLFLELAWLQNENRVVG
jgi:hypothetical protein